jgi:hypothetical protein
MVEIKEISSAKRSDEKKLCGFENRRNLDKVSLIIR